MKDLAQLLQEIKIQKLKKLDEEYEIKKNKILSLNFDSISELVYNNKQLISDYPELSKYYITHVINIRSYYDDRNFYKNQMPITFNEFKKVLNLNISELAEYCSSYEDEITFKIGSDTYSVCWYSGD